jgi:hypothetical protein
MAQRIPRLSKVKALKRGVNTEISVLFFAMGHALDSALTFRSISKMPVVAD